MCYLKGSGFFDQNQSCSVPVFRIVHNGIGNFENASGVNSNCNLRVSQGAFALRGRRGILEQWRFTLRFSSTLPVCSTLPFLRATFGFEKTSPLWICSVAISRCLHLPRALFGRNKRPNAGSVCEYRSAFVAIQWQTNMGSVLRVRPW